MPLRAVALNCSLKSSSTDDGQSSTEQLLTELLDALATHGVQSDAIVRVADLNLRPGVSSDEGDGDDWPDVRAKIVDAEILVIGTPIWMGHPSSFAQRVLERLDAMLAEYDERGRLIAFDKVALVAVVGNEDGAHLVGSQLFQGLNDVGFTIPAAGMTYWVGEAMQRTDYVDLPSGSDKTNAATGMAARNAAHLAGLLAEGQYPAGD